VIGRHPEREAGSLDLALGPHQPLGHDGLGDQEGAGDLAGGQAAKRPKGQSDLRVDGERGMTASKDQLESLVGKRGRGHRVPRCLRHLEQSDLGGPAFDHGGCG